MLTHNTTLPARLSLPVGRAFLQWLGCREQLIRRTLILTILYLMPAIWVLQPAIADNDIWWHLQTGKWIVDHGMLPTTDPFSAFGEGKPWIAYSWLFEVGMYGLVRLFGDAAINLYTLAAVWLIIGVVHWILAKRCAQFSHVCILLLTTVFAMAGLYIPRPWLLTILFFAITLQVVLSLRDDHQPRWIWALPVVYMLWANVHIQFIYGLGLLGLACLAPLSDRVLRRYSDVQTSMVWGSQSWKTLVGLTALCTSATLLTPHHLRLYSIVFDLSTQMGVWEYIQEMQAPSFRSITDWVMLGMFATALVQIGRRKSWSSFEILLLLVASVSAFRAMRDGWFLVMSAVVVLTPRHAGEEQQHSEPLAAHRGFIPISVLLAAGVVVLFGFRDMSSERIQAETAKLYPLGAASFIEQQGYTGPLYNHFNWGGYLIWRLPHLKVSMDGRTNIHGDERIKQAIATWTGGPHWREDPELANARVIIVKRDMTLASLLRLDERFTEVYRDETAVVFIPAVRDLSQPQPVEASSQIASFN
jgi:hypothetical protein